MKDSVILEKLNLLVYNTFDLFGYRIPKKAIKDFKDGRHLELDIQQFRQKQLELRLNYPTTYNFKKCLSEDKFLQDLFYIEEFPVVISNRESWENLNSGLDSINKSCIFFDFFCPQYNLIIELDGKAFHSSNNIQQNFELESKDHMRDKYCNTELGAYVLRLKSFGKVQNENKIEIDLLKNTIKQLQPNNSNKYHYDYSKFILTKWKLEHKSELDFIENIEQHFNNKIENDNCPIVIIKMNKEYKSIITKDFINKVNNIFKIIYNKTIDIRFK